MPVESLASRRGRARTVVETCGGNIAAAARQLGVTRKTLYGEWRLLNGSQLAAVDGQGEAEVALGTILDLVARGF